MGREWYLTVVSICISLITNDAGHVFHMLVSQLNTYFEEMSIQHSLPILQNWVVYFVVEV